MNEIINNWKDSVKIKRILIVAMVIIIVAVSLGSYLYYSHHQEQEKIKIAKELKIKQEQAGKKTIEDFYENAFEGGSIDKLVVLLNEINRSRVNIERSGFTEYAYQCNQSTCNFNYKLRQGALFSVQEKIFYKDRYKPSFSADELSYNEVLSKLDSNKIKNKFNNEEKITPPSCSNVLNFIYSYNSLQDDPNEKIIITSLPTSSVSSQEDTYPNYQYSYGFMVGNISLTHSDNAFKMKTFWERKPYKDYFLFDSFQKTSEINNIIQLNGKFICKK